MSVEITPMRHTRARQTGFTLLEIMVVVVIIGLLAAIVAPNLIGNIDTAEANAAKSELGQIRTQLDIYRMDNYRYPSTTEGLEALVDNPGENVAPQWRQYLNKLPDDPWGRPYEYRSPGQGGAPFDLFTLGRDGREGGEGVDADISVADL